MESASPDGQEPFAALGYKQPKKRVETRIWEIADKAVRKLEEEFERVALGIEQPKPPDHTTIDEALEIYFVDRAQHGRGVSEHYGRTDKSGAPVAHLQSA